MQQLVKCTVVHMQCVSTGMKRTSTNRLHASAPPSKDSDSDMSKLLSERIAQLDAVNTTRYSTLSAKYDELTVKLDRMATSLDEMRAANETAPKTTTSSSSSSSTSSSTIIRTISALMVMAAPTIKMVLSVT